MRNIQLFDTTLRDGEQTPGVHLARDGKLEIARALARMKVDIIEAGFPVSSKNEFKCVELISQEVREPIICALARCSDADIEAAAASLDKAAHPRIHVFIATSDIHMKYKLKMTRDEVISHIAHSVAYARSLCSDVEFSAEDAGRSDPEFLFAALQTAIANGASTVNIPDTVGYNSPAEFGKLIYDAAHNVRGIENAVISAHCHNDLGLAVANSLAAIQNGASQIECTINGIGERAGNAALEEIAMSLYTRGEYYGCRCGIDTTRIAETSRIVSSLCSVVVPPNKPIVGANAFAHESGIHQHGMLANAATYEIMTPESVGCGKTQLILGKLSGRHAFAEHVAELGYTLSDEAVNACFTRFKDYADKKNVSDDDIMALVNEYLDSRDSVYALDTFQIQSGNRMMAMAMVTLSCRGATLSDSAVGDGPISAAFNAIQRLSGADSIRLDEYNIKAVTEGADALGEAKVKITIDGASFTGRSAAPDIIEASIRAYVNALNKWAAI